MSAKLVELRQVCEFLDSQRVPVTESDREPGPYPYYGANGQQGWIDNYVFDEPLVLLAEDGGHFGSYTQPIAYKITGKSWVNNHAHVLRPKSNCDIDYLHRVLSFYDVTRWVSGTTRPKLTKGKAEEIPIPLPPLPEQKRIAAILDKADRLRRLRRYVLELGDTYLQSVFLEMFGDALAGKDKNAPLTPLEQVCTKITDGTHVTPTYLESGVPFLSVKNLTHIPGKLDFSDVKYISPEQHEQIWKACPVERDDVLYTKVGATYGIPQIVETDIKFSIFVSVALLKPDKNVIISKYFESALRTDFAKRQADRLVSGIGVPDLHLREIKTIVIPLPDFSRQRRFVEVARKYERLRAQQREAERQAEHLFQSLLHRAFAGEL